MCTFCIVPFTRGRERSRPSKSIEEEVQQLSKEGYKEIVLLGQNVNSYNDKSEIDNENELEKVKYVEGFKTVYKTPTMGTNFTELVDRISKIDPEMRIRFTSPHPKDFPDELINIIQQRPNVCKYIHVPLQSGSTTVLDRMRRGYTREAYIDLIESIKKKVPQITISSDFITGFCNETEDEHNDTLSVLDLIKYEFAYMFSYSMREKTPAHRRYEDDVPFEVKKRRLKEINEYFYRNATEKNLEELNKKHLVLVEGQSDRKSEYKMGKTDTNKTVLFPDIELYDPKEGKTRKIIPGDYVSVQVDKVKGLSLIGNPLEITTLTKYYELSN